jgi:hypothetical protein
VQAPILAQFGADEGYTFTRVAFEFPAAHTIGVEGHTDIRTRVNMKDSPLDVSITLSSDAAIQNNCPCRAVLTLERIDRLARLGASGMKTDFLVAFAMFHWLPLSSNPDDTNSAWRYLAKLISATKTLFFEIPGLEEYEEHNHVQGFGWLRNVLRQSGGELGFIYDSCSRHGLQCRVTNLVELPATTGVARKVLRIDNLYAFDEDMPYERSKAATVRRVGRAMLSTFDCIACDPNSCQILVEPKALQGPPSDSSSAYRLLAKDAERVVVLSDPHADLSGFQDVLERNNIAVFGPIAIQSMPLHPAVELALSTAQPTVWSEARVRWTGGRTIVAITGDSMDFGSQSRVLLDTFMSLQVQAQAPGGQLLVLLGDHDIDILKIQPSTSKKRSYHNPDDELPHGSTATFFDAFSLHPTIPPTSNDYDALQRLWYGWWMRLQPFVVAIEDTVMVHSPPALLSRLTLDQINWNMYQSIHCNTNPSYLAPVYPKGSGVSLLEHLIGFNRTDRLPRRPQCETLTDIFLLMQRGTGVHRIRRLVVGHLVTDGTARAFCNGSLVLMDTCVTKDNFKSYERGTCASQALELTLGDNTGELKWQFL